MADEKDVENLENILKSSKNAPVIKNETDIKKALLDYVQSFEPDKKYTEVLSKIPEKSRIRIADGFPKGIGDRGNIFNLRFISQNYEKIRQNIDKIEIINGDVIKEIQNFQPISLDFVSFNNTLDYYDWSGPDVRNLFKTVAEKLKIGGHVILASTLHGDYISRAREDPKKEYEECKDDLEKLKEELKIEINDNRYYWGMSREQREIDKQYKIKGLEKEIIEYTKKLKTLEELAKKPFIKYRDPQIDAYRLDGSFLTCVEHDDGRVTRDFKDTSILTRSFSGGYIPEISRDYGKKVYLNEVIGKRFAVANLIIEHRHTPGNHVGMSFGNDIVGGGGGAVIEAYQKNLMFVED